MMVMSRKEMEKTLLLPCDGLHFLLINFNAMQQGPCDDDQI
jgi:hypothetical protein